MTTRIVGDRKRERERDEVYYKVEVHVAVKTYTYTYMRQYIYSKFGCFQPKHKWICKKEKYHRAMFICLLSCGARPCIRAYIYILWDDSEPELWIRLVLFHSLLCAHIDNRRSWHCSMACLSCPVTPYIKAENHWYSYMYVIDDSTLHSISCSNNSLIDMIDFVYIYIKVESG